MKIEIVLELTEEELEEFVEIIEDTAHNSGQELPILEKVLEQLRDI